MYCVYIRYAFGIDRQGRRPVHGIRSGGLRSRIERERRLFSVGRKRSISVKEEILRCPEAVCSGSPTASAGPDDLSGRQDGVSLLAKAGHERLPEPLGLLTTAKLLSGTFRIDEASFVQDIR